jgi:hypothetical protein
MPTPRSLYPTPVYWYTGVMADGKGDEYMRRYGIQASSQIGATQGSMKDKSKRHVPKNPTITLQKATYYLSKDVLDKLDSAWLNEREACKTRDVKPPSKSSLVDEAIERYLADSRH